MRLRGPLIVKLTLLIILILRLSVALAATNETVNGFQVDFQLVNEDQKSAMLPSLVGQLKIVDSVNLPQALISFFRRVRIVVDPDLRSMPGQYTNLNGQWVVRVQSRGMPENRPIVLHELLHAYHHQVLTIQNRDIEDAYLRAKEPGIYPRDFQFAHFLENSKEYFAVIGSIYLFGQIQQPPFNCAIPSKTDPVFLSFLSRQFGPHACN